MGIRAGPNQAPAALLTLAVVLIPAALLVLVVFPVPPARQVLGGLQVLPDHKAYREFKVLRAL